MNILVTGAAGFIGSHLMGKLEELGHKVVGIDNYSHPCRNNTKTTYADVKNRRDLTPFFFGCEVVFHLAAQISVDKSIYDPDETIMTNVLGTQNVLELARKHGTRVVFASSSEIYGSAQMIRMGEGHPLDPQSPYGASKLAGDRLCYAYSQTFPKMNICVVRNFNTFGEYQSDDSYGGVIAKFARLALKNEPLTIYGDGSQRRDYMHVRDAVQAYLLAMDKKNGVYNFGSGQTIGVLELAHKIIEMTGSKSEVCFLPARQGEVQHLEADIQKACQELGFEPRTNFWKDLGDYIQWVRKTGK